MIPILYESTETAFVSNGLGRLRDAVSCIVTEERNGIYECDLEYPVDGAHFELIQPGRIIAVTHDDTNDVQPFDIVSFTKPISGIVTFHCVHISYRLSGYTATGSNINSLSDALTMLSTAEPAIPFTFTTDMTSSAFMASADGTPRSVREYMGGIEGSILDAYGGEWQFDRFTVNLKRNRGVQRDFSIRYGVNLLDYNEDTDYQGTYTSCIPYWTGTDNNGAEVKLVANKVDSGLIGYNGREVCVPLDLTDKFETIPTTAQLEAEALSQMQSQQVNLPSQTIKVDFVRLQDLGYGDLGRLLSCQLCDTLTVIFPYYGTQGQFKIVKTVWNVLEERFDDMELGTLQTSLAEALGISNNLEKASGGGGGMFTPTRLTFSGTASSFTSGTTLKTLSVDQAMAAGFWIIVASCRYGSNSTGYRAIQITADGTGQNVSLMQTPAGGTGNVDLVTSAIIEKSAAWTLDLNGRQNSGSSMNVDWYIQAIKVGEAS
jgi:phage minor structural protein